MCILVYFYKYASKFQKRGKEAKMNYSIRTHLASFLNLSKTIQVVLKLKIPIKWNFVV